MCANVSESVRENQNMDVSLYLAVPIVLSVGKQLNSQEQLCGFVLEYFLENCILTKLSSRL